MITPPGWEGELPAGAEQIEATTPQVFMLGRFLVDDEADIADVTAISRQSSLRPLSALTGEAAAPAPPPLGEPAGTAQDIPADATFFDELGDALAVNPPTTPVQRDLFTQFEALGDRRDVLDRGAEQGDGEIGDKATGIAEPVNGWSANLDIVLSHTEPGAGNGAGTGSNWLPVPDGPFVLMLRLYLPGPPVLDGSYEYPPVERLAD